MAIEYSLEFEVASRVNAVSTASGKQTGPRSGASSFAVVSGSEEDLELPIVAVSLGEITTSVAGVELALALTTNPGGGVDYEPLNGTDPTGLKLAYLWFKNLDDTDAVNISIPASNGLAGLGWGASDHIGRVDPTPGGKLEFVWKNGSSTLNSGTNDKIKLTAVANTPIVEVFAGFI